MHIKFSHTMNKTTYCAIVLDNMNVVNASECSLNNLNTLIYKQNAFNIFTINICSLQKHFDELCIIMDNMENKFEVIVLTEAWLGLDKISITNFLMNGYTVHSTKINKNQNDGFVFYLKET